MKMSDFIIGVMLLMLVGVVVLIMVYMIYMKVIRPKQWRVEMNGHSYNVTGVVNNVTRLVKNALEVDSPYTGKRCTSVYLCDMG